MIEKFFVAGLGSMGKRRIRCLKSLGYSDITGIDPRSDRRKEAELRFGVETVESYEALKEKAYDALIISTPPELHLQYIKHAIDKGKPAFIEASVILEHVLEARSYNKRNVFLAPSCTLRFHPVIQDITSIIRSGKFGKVTNFSYHSGQYLPDWHPWEKISDFYVSKKETGGGREIVPFELTWIVDTIGWPEDAKGYFGRTIELDSDIDDTYAFVLKYKDKTGCVTVDVAARYATRSLIINLENGQIQWRWDEGCFHVYDASKGRWIKYDQPESSAAEGYNKNIGEGMYIEEVRCFIEGINAPEAYPNTIDDDIKILEILNKIENSDGGFKK